MSNKVKIESIGNSVLGWVIAFALLTVLFNGSPDVADYITMIFEGWAAE